MIERTCALVLVALASMLLLRELGWRATPLVAVCVTVGSLGMLMPYAEKLSEELGLLSEGVGAPETVRDILKVVGVGYLSGLVGEVCRSMGEASLASAVSLVGRAEMLIIAFPYFFETVTLGLELLK
ncbi:MAG: stage III sporulation AC/AD family protein [Clostridia bacterium]|nr:stage III sporulation AC/AD family protein [Clostridia bacterium]